MSIHNFWLIAFLFSIVFIHQEFAMESAEKNKTDITELPIELIQHIIDQKIPKYFNFDDPNEVIDTIQSVLAFVNSKKEYREKFRDYTINQLIEKITKAWKKKLLPHKNRIKKLILAGLSPIEYPIPPENHSIKKLFKTAIKRKSGDALLIFIKVFFNTYSTYVPGTITLTQEVLWNADVSQLPFYLKVLDIAKKNDPNFDPNPILNAPTANDFMLYKTPMPQATALMVAIELPEFETVKLLLKKAEEWGILKQTLGAFDGKWKSVYSYAANKDEKLQNLLREYQAKISSKK